MNYPLKDYKSGQMNSLLFVVTDKKDKNGEINPRTQDQLTQFFNKFELLVAEYGLDIEAFGMLEPMVNRLHIKERMKEFQAKK